MYNATDFLHWSCLSSIKESKLGADIARDAMVVSKDVLVQYLLAIAFHKIAVTP